jgi:hypothetical protein
MGTRPPFYNFLLAIGVLAVVLLAIAAPSQAQVASSLNNGPLVYVAAGTWWVPAATLAVYRSNTF